MKNKRVQVAQSITVVNTIITFTTSDNILPKE